MPIVIPTGSSPTLSDLISRIRTDLFDAGQRIGDEPRWSDTDLTRALDRANDRYSSVAPYLKELQLPTFPFSRIYATPEDSWYVQAAEYPYGLWPHWQQPFKERNSPYIDAPASAGTASLQSGGALSSGVYSWAMTFYVPGGGETTPTTIATATATAGQRAVLTLPQGPYGVTDRRVYRTQVGGFTYTLVGSAGDNESTTTFADTASDASIAGAATPPPTNTTQGIPQVELQISDSKLSNHTNANGQDPNYGWIGLRYASKHELDANGTTIPERHWDVLCLGAEMYAVMAYLTPTADNFHYVDGQFRDQVDDHFVPLAWLQIAERLSTSFQARLADLKLEDNANASAIASWGDKPLRWDRL